MDGAAWFRVVNTYIAAGGEFTNGKISRCAPIIKYMAGWSVERLIGYCRNKDWDLEIYNEQF